jgi:excisionase family DNA binding protein
LERATYSVREAARLLGIGRNAMYEAVRLGRVEVLRVGRKARIPRPVLERLLQNPRALTDRKGTSG